MTHENEKNSNSGASDRISRAHAMLEHLKSTESGPDIELAELQLSLAEVSRTGGAQQEAALKLLLQQSQQLGQRYGQYWQSRAEALMVGSMETNSETDPSPLATELVLVEVRQLLAAEQTSAAVDKLLAFRDRQAAAGRGDSALRTAAQAAALLARLQHWAQAAETLALTSRQFSELSSAAESHRQAIYYQSQALRETTEQAAIATRYEALLQDQLKQWPEAASTDEVAGWMRLWWVQAGRRDELCEIWLQRAIACQQPEHLAAALFDWLGELLLLESSLSVEKQLTSISKARQEAHLPGSPAYASAAQIFGGVTALEPTDEELRQAVRDLSRLEGLQQDEDWKQLLLAVRWLLSIRQQQRPEEIPVELLSWQPERLPVAVRQGLARCLVAAIDETPMAEHSAWAQRVKLDEAWREQLMTSSIPGLQATGFRLQAWSDDASAGLDGLTQLCQQAARGGGTLQLELADALADSGPNRWQQSSEVAKIVVANSPAGSELNWQARWRLVKNHLLLGEKAQAEQMAKLWLATQPGHASLWKSRFEGVLSEARPNN